MARMINSRLVWYLERHKLITPVQSGFRKQRSTYRPSSLLGSIRPTFKLHVYTNHLPSWLSDMDDHSGTCLPYRHPQCWWTETVAIGWFRSGAALTRTSSIQLTSGVNDFLHEFLSSAAARSRNHLPASIRNALSVATFRRHLKNHLFRSSYYTS